MNNTEAKRLKLDFSFLLKGENYNATIYSDDDSVVTKTKVGIKKIQVNSLTKLDIQLKASGGQAVLLEPVK